MIKTENLTKQFDTTTALDCLSTTIEEGRIYGLVGSNGAGKSTLMDSIAGIHRPCAGKIYYKGEDITGQPANVVVEKGLSLVPQGSRCFVRMSVEDNLFVGSYPKRARSKAKENLEKIYTLFPVLKEKRRDASGSLSGGQRQMVAIGRALMANPDLVLFDEISLGLAPTIIKDIYARIREINQNGLSIVLVEQDIQRSKKTSELSYIMLKGKVVLSGRSRELSDEEIKNAYFGI